jgi:membrane associated rhomboid family serine protease
MRAALFRKDQSERRRRSQGGGSSSLAFYQKYDEEFGAVTAASTRSPPSKRGSGGWWGSKGEEENVEEEEEEIYIVRQKYGYGSIGFSLVQIGVLAWMMYSCGIAPLRLNPMIGPFPDGLSEWGGKNSYLILDEGESYRLLTPIFLHAGVLHLIGNVAVQLETGLFFEKEWGTMRWLIIYLVSAVGSSILSVIAMPQAISVGSSGAVMGLFGGKLAEVIVRAMECCNNDHSQQERVARTVRKEQCCLVSTSVVIVMLFSFIPFVDWAAHLGGLISGFLIGLAIFPFDLQSTHWSVRIVCGGLGLTVTIICFAQALAYMYGGQVQTIDELKDVCGYYKKNFEDYECNCMREEHNNNNNNNNEKFRRLFL